MPKHNEMHDIEKLIIMVKNRPAIYNYSCAEHKNKEYTDILWKEISDAINISTSLCKSKWLALRNSYSREIRNEKEANAHPYNNRKKRRKWYLADDMSFLREYLNYGQQKKRNSISDDQNDDDDVVHINSDGETCSSLLTEKVEKKYIAKEESDVKIHSDHMPSQSIAFESVHQSPTPTPAENPIEDPFKEYSFMIKRNRQEEINELQEQNMTFFKSILPDILKLSERRQRLFKQEILSVLNRSLDEQEIGS